MIFQIILVTLFYTQVMEQELLKYPVVKSSSFLFFTPFLFDIISPFLDWTYFVKTELEI